MDIDELVKKRKGLNAQEHWVFNPFSDDFTFVWDGETHTIPALSDKSFPYYLREHAAKKLVDKLINENHKGFVDDKVREKYRREVII